MGKEQWPAGESRTPEQRCSEKRAHTGGRFRSLEEVARAKPECGHDVGSPHRGPPSGMASSRGHRRPRGDAGSTRGVGCGCLPLWALFVTVLVLSFLVTRVPVSALAGSDTICGDRSVIDCAMNTVTILERSLDQIDDFEQDPDAPFEREPEDPFQDLESY